MSDFAPVFLSRAGNPVWNARAFLASFFAHDPGPKVSLIFVQKGYGSGKTDPALDELTASQRMRIRLLDVSDEGMDLEAYAKACRLVTDYSHLLFFNSNCILLCENWYDLYRAALDASNGNGLVGATASWEAMEYLGVQFPNPHIRTNAFLVDRATYLQVYGPDVRQDKDSCYLFESGPQSLTAHFLQSDRPVHVIGRDGGRYPPEEWAGSHTFRSGNQENLVVSDNQTRRFQRMGTKRRRRLAHDVWGDSKIVVPARPLEPLILKTWYEFLYSGYRFRRHVSGKR